ncbi:PREDICTED: protein MIZU-KUSSEI 1 [Tarenaya hassleriana]|uniref:protein MIZU-KUSSEI 1 n=1 Tax=Tarenaya hassleriana TaxID=28532 RepID=UPI00053C79F3|nr:PREDICTED: protein MIZU-KUSSEI 1 [Tarenaya hassleriana]
MSYPKIAPAATAIPSAVVTTVDCHKQVRSWRLLRSVMELLIPTCNCAFVQEHEQENPNLQSKQLYNETYSNPHKSRTPSFRSSSPSSTTVTGTIFGYHGGKISFCIQKSSKSTNPELLLELAVPTTVLAREMRGGVLRIVLECNTESERQQNDKKGDSVSWNMYCNGKRVGYARRRRPSKEDAEALAALRSVVVGAGVVSGKELEGDGGGDELMYLRANFRRVSGSNKESESFHLIDPAENIGQELSIYLLR